jgi:hypothetical protein
LGAAGNHFPFGSFQPRDIGAPEQFSRAQSEQAVSGWGRAFLSKRSRSIFE